MNTKTLDQYFESARSLPVAMSVEEVQALVKINAVSMTGQSHSSWWTTKNFIFMTTAAAIITTTVLFMNPSERIEEQPVIKTEKIEKKIEVMPTALPEKEDVKQPVIQIDTTKKTPEHPAPEIEAAVEVEHEAPLVVVEPVTVEIEPIAPISEPVYVARTAGVVSLGYATGTKATEGRTKTIEKELAVKGAEWLVVNNFKGDITIETWDKPSVQMSAFLTVDGATEEDAQKALDELDIDLVHKGNKITLEKKGWSMFDDDDCTCPSGSVKGKITTKKGEKLRVRKYAIDYVITVPKSMNLELKDSYGNITIKDVDGDVKASNFQGSFTAGNIGGNLFLKEKYGNAQVGNFKSGDISLFHGKAKLGMTNELDLSAKYSDVDVVGAEELELVAFQSNITIKESLKKVTGNLKYGDLVIGNNVDKLNLSVFQANLEAKEMGDLDFEGSYSDVKADAIKSVYITSSFQNNFRVGEMAAIKGDAKYSRFDIGTLKGSLDLAVFQGSIDIDNVMEEFSSLEIDAKYTPIDLNFSRNAKFNIDAQTSYTDFNYPEAAMQIDYETKEHHKMNFKGVYNANNTKEPSMVNVTCFQGKLNLR